ncbi:exocyst complex component 8 [Anaeramoeba flamelloides]|uniref:Exocyst complex component 8 n=1 Tax=Anaeramoeba flamelloides TaxID=1746091 RepID=A0ABQ8Y459_9EUKA|nr:exocyst complex component 8 [Anaeramoeba flamelloides]
MNSPIKSNLLRTNSFFNKLKKTGNKNRSMKQQTPKSSQFTRFKKIENIKTKKKDKQDNNSPKEQLKLRQQELLHSFLGVYDIENNKRNSSQNKKRNSQTNLAYQSLLQSNRSSKKKMKDVMLKGLIEKKIKPVEFIRLFCEHHTSSEIREQSKLLEKEKKKASESVRDSVSKDYPSYIETAQEISKIEQDLIRIKRILQENSNCVSTMETITILKQTENDLPKKKISDEQKDNINKTWSWLFDAPDKLEQLISERNFEQAVELLYHVRIFVDKNFEKIGKYEEFRKKRFPQIKENLAKNLYIELKEYSQNEEKSREIVKLLIKIGREERAREILLESRSNIIKKEIKALNLEGDIFVYVTQVSEIVFRCLAQACDDFQHSFEDNQKISSLIDWIGKEVENYTTILTRQLLHNENFQIIMECVEQAHKYCNGLEKKGVSFKFLLKRKFHPLIVKSLKNEIKHRINEITKNISEDDWKLQNLALKNPPKETDNTSRNKNAKNSNTKSSQSGGSNKKTIQLTSSGKQMYKIINIFIADITEIFNLNLYDHVISSIQILFRHYLEKLKEDMLKKTALQTQKDIAKIANSFNIYDDLLPRVARRFQTLLQRPIIELDSFRNKLEKLHFSMVSTFVKRITNSILNQEKLKKLEARYAQNSAHKNEPSKIIQQVFEGIYSLSNPLSKSSLKPVLVDKIISSSILRITEIFLNKMESWTGQSKRCIFGLHGLQYFVIDMFFITTVSGFYSNKEIDQNISNLIYQATHAFCSVNKKDPENVLRQNSWFIKRVERCINNHRIFKNLEMI